MRPSHAKTMVNIMLTEHELDDAAWLRNRLRWTSAMSVASICVFVMLVLAAPALVDSIGLRPGVALIAALSSFSTWTLLWSSSFRRRLREDLSSAELHEELERHINQ